MLQSRISLAQLALTTMSISLSVSPLPPDTAGDSGIKQIEARCWLQISWVVRAMTLRYGLSFPSPRGPLVAGL